MCYIFCQNSGIEILLYIFCSYLTLRIYRDVNVVFSLCLPLYILSQQVNVAYKLYLKNEVFRSRVFSKCEQIRSFVRIFSYLLKKS